MLLYICPRVGAALSKLSSSHLEYRPLRFCSAKPMDKSISSSDSASGGSYNTGVSQTYFLDKSRNSYGNQRKTDDRNHCDAGVNYEDDFPSLSSSCSRSKVSKADRKGKGDPLKTKRTHDELDVTLSKVVSSVDPTTNSLLAGDASISPTSKISSQVLVNGFEMRHRLKQINVEKGERASDESKHSDFIRRTSTKVERLRICSFPPVKKDSSRVLRSGMVLLKSYISLPQQVKIVKTCNQLGDGAGGFYRPGYEDGGKLRLYMMCLGKNWDPRSGYKVLHPIDDCKAPAIPPEFILLVEQSIQDARGLIDEEGNVTHILPSMSPDICIANFYTKTGRLGLHQDRDESLVSRRKGLPVISFSIGDSAVFLFGDDRTVDKAEEVVLESGDVLLFGGKSRMVFHGVSTLIPDTAPAWLREETGLIPGRLNLTFRKF